MAGSENSKSMTGQRFKSALNSCISDIRVAMNFMKDNGRRMKGIKGLIIVNGVTLTTISLATRTVKSQTPIISTVDSVMLDVILVGVQQNSIVFHVLLMANLRLIMKEEQFVLRNVGMGFYL